MGKEESSEDIKRERQKRLENINQWNNAMRCDGYQPTLKEEMNLTGDPNFRYVGKGSFFLNLRRGLKCQIY